MEEITKMKVDWKKLTVVIALVLLTGLTVGGLTWYVATSGAQDEMEAYKNDIARLETEIKQLQDEEVPTEGAATETTGDPTSSWKTFANTTTGFTVKTPNNWTVTENTANGVTTLALQGDFKINILAYSLSQPAGGDMGMAGNSIKHTSSVVNKMLTLGEGVAQTTENVTGYALNMASVEYDNNGLSAWSYVTSQGDLTKYDPTFVQILETLKFN